MQRTKVYCDLCLEKLTLETRSHHVYYKVLLLGYHKCPIPFRYPTMKQMTHTLWNLLFQVHLDTSGFQYTVIELYICTFLNRIYICSYVTSAAKLRHASWIILNNIALTYMHACSDQKTSTGVMHVKCVFARNGSKPICNNSLNLYMYIIVSII